MSSSNADEYPLQVVLEATDHEALRVLLRTVQEKSIEATVASIEPATLTSTTAVTVNLDILTEKQRETLALALSKGYYERPRQTDLTALADQLDISKSAVSQRIRNAEIKLIKRAFEPYR